MVDKILHRKDGKTGCGLVCPGRVHSSCSTCDTRCVTLVNRPVINWLYPQVESTYMTALFHEEGRIGSIKLV